MKELIAKIEALPVGKSLHTIHDSEVKNRRVETTLNSCPLTTDDLKALAEALVVAKDALVVAENCIHGLRDVITRRDENIWFWGDGSLTEVGKRTNADLNRIAAALGK